MASNIQPRPEVTSRRFLDTGWPVEGSVTVVVDMAAALSRKVAHGNGLRRRPAAPLAPKNDSALRMPCNRFKSFQSEIKARQALAAIN